MHFTYRKRREMAMWQGFSIDNTIQIGWWPNIIWVFVPTFLSNRVFEVNRRWDRNRQIHLSIIEEVIVAKLNKTQVRESFLITLVFRNPVCFAYCTKSVYPLTALKCLGTRRRKLLPATRICSLIFCKNQQHWPNF